MTPLKFVVSGPVGAGKTTFIRSISQTEVVSTEEISSEQIGKTHTTVAMDFGQIDVGEHVLHLFGTPGQTRFDYMWDILSEGALGLIMLVPCDAPNEFPQARRILEYVVSRHPVEFIIGLTRTDLSANGWNVPDVAAYFGLPEQQVLAVNPRDTASARGAIHHLLQRL